MIEGIVDYFVIMFTRVINAIHVWDYSIAKKETIGTFLVLFASKTLLLVSQRNNNGINNLRKEATVSCE